MKKTSILLVDDHAVVRMGLSAIINLQADLKVCGEAENGETAVRLAAELKPDVVVMDFSLPGMDGAEATAAVLKVSPTSKVLILTSFGTSADLARAMAAGAIGAVTKNLSNDELSSAIRDTARGIQHFSPEIRQTLSDGTDDKAFTKRQMEVLDSITRGLSNDDIALMLGISKSRVKQHLNEVYEKLGASNRAEAVAIAMRRQLLKF
jgi:DNA-binding NarL/FixJ family response regulator